MKPTAVDLDALIAAVLESAKNRHVSPEVIRQVGEQELRSRSSVKEAIKETKNRLHQAAGAYLDRTPNYDRWSRDLALAADETAVNDLCLNWMQSHSSTRERIPILESFYRITIQSLTRSADHIDSVIDIACGLNPLAIPWMGLAANTRYMAYDIYADMAGFLSEYLLKSGIEGEVRTCNCAASPPEQKADLALILKFLPVLEQLEKGSTLNWLKRINAPNLLISFPTRSLGGKAKGMAQYYEARFLETVSGENWAIEKSMFESELCFLVKR